MLGGVHNQNFEYLIFSLFEYGQNRGGGHARRLLWVAGKERQGWGRQGAGRGRRAVQQQPPLGGGRTNPRANSGGAAKGARWEQDKTQRQKHGGVPRRKRVGGLQWEHTCPVRECVRKCSGRSGKTRRASSRRRIWGKHTMGSVWDMCATKTHYSRCPSSSVGTGVNTGRDRRRKDETQGARRLVRGG